jgi:biopolymer transport protein ExbD
MLKSSPLMGNRKSNMVGPLTKMSAGLNGSAKSSHSMMATVLPLTSLIDAFSIIVIYLLIGTQSGGIDSNLSKTISLPLAQEGAEIREESAVVRIENGIYYINEQPVAADQLGSHLASLKKSSGEDLSIIIQADQKMNYAWLDPLLRAGSEAGVQKLKFAVAPTR